MTQKKEEDKQMYMSWKSNKVKDMSETRSDNLKLVRLASIDEQPQLRAILQTNPSTISFETINLPKSILDILDGIYSNRTHRRCIHISYLTLLAMTLTVVFWMFYWLAYNRCQNLLNPFLCDLEIIFEVLTFTFISLSPVLFVFMIYSWVIYSCYNPFDFIRENFVGFKIEGEQWKQQLDDYYHRKKSRYLNCLRCKQRQELHDRGYGYIILSPHGIVIDELIILTARKRVVENGIFLDRKKVLRLTFQKTCKRPWKIQTDIYLNDDLINQRAMEELMESLKIPINIDAMRPPCY